MTGPASNGVGLHEALAQEPDSGSGGTWSLRWDTLGDKKPRLTFHAGIPSLGSSVHETNAGTLVAFEGYLFDRPELGGVAAQSDASVIAAAYGKWGEALFKRLRGGFILAIWDARDGRLLVCRDATGLGTCFYAWDGRVFALSASLDAVLAQPGVDRSFNRALIAEHLRCSWTSHQRDETLYCSVKRLLPAHSLAVSKGKVSVSRYWDPLPPGFSWARREEIGQFRPTLERAVSRCLDIGADSVSLSGGFDSVSLAVVAADQLREHASLHAISLRFDNPMCDEWETQSAVAKALGMPQLKRDFKDCLDEEHFLENEMALAAMNPCPVLSPWQSMYKALFRTAAGLGLKRVLSGSGGDELFMVGFSHGADRLAAFDLPGLWLFLRSYQRSFPAPLWRVARRVLWRGAVKPEVKRRLRSILGATTKNGRSWLDRRLYERSQNPWVRPTDGELANELIERYLNPTVAARVPGEGFYAHAIRSHHLYDPLSLMILDQGSVWAKSVGFTVLLPYRDPDLVDLTLRMPPETLFSGGQSKAPLHRLVAERIPTVMLPKRKNVAAQMARESFLPVWRKAWSSLPAPFMLTELEIMDSRKLNDLMGGFFARQNDQLMLAWTVLNTEIWLRARSKLFGDG